MSWYPESAKARRLLAQERLAIRTIEAISEAIDRRGVTRRRLAGALQVKPSEISERLSGRRNMTLRSVADMLDALDFDLEVRLRDRYATAQQLRTVVFNLDGPLIQDVRPGGDSASEVAPRYQQHLQLVHPAA